MLGTRKLLISLLVMAGLSFLSACSSSNGETSLSESTTTFYGNPGTLPPISTAPTSAFTLDVQTTIAFLDSCISDSGLVGPCHCASELLVSNVDVNDVQGLEDRMSAFNEFPIELAGLLAECRGAPRPAAWSAPSLASYLTVCMQGSSRLDDLCRCSVSRAVDVIPEQRLAEFLEAETIRPDMVDLINTCL